MYDWKDHLVMGLIVGVVAYLQQRGIVKRESVLFWCGVFICALLATVIYYAPEVLGPAR